MISKNQLKHLRSLGQKKYRKLHQQALVQGFKNVVELLNSNWRIEHIFATDEFINANQALLKNITVTQASEDELQKGSTLQSNNAAIAVVSIPSPTEIDLSDLVIALDGVSDPGNLGTIIRLADWFGIKHIVCSPNCADAYNPKTISATMGSFSRINVHYKELTHWLSDVSVPVIGAFLGGTSVHSHKFNRQGILVMGSESHGISDEVANYINHRITIPGYGMAESLNVAMACGIILDNARRQLN